jgi:hypothetical protein
MTPGASQRSSNLAGGQSRVAGRPRLRSYGDPSALALMPPPGIDPPVHAAVTDLCVYVLVLDAERERLSAQAHRLARSGTEPWKEAELDETGAEITKELEALREMIVALQQGQPRVTAS